MRNSFRFDFKPGTSVPFLGDVNSVEAVYETEQTLGHLFQREVGTERLFIEIVARAPQLLDALLQLRDLARLALSGVERVFTAQTEFDPASSTREFSLLVSDYVVAVLGNSIASLLAAEAPRTRLRMISNTTALVDDAARTLVSTDLMIIPHGFVEDLSHHDLYRDEWVCLVSAENAGVADLSPLILKDLGREDALGIACHPHHRTTRRMEISTC